MNMDRETVRELLLQLRDTIRDEREHAKALDLAAMIVDVKRKEAILRALNSVETLHPDDQQFAREIRQENRRNAFLFRATLNWIQDTMEFFGRKTVPVTYSQRGLSQNTTINGRLLSGQI
jgi:flagellar biosynthesis/type III secretory pathway chaperone